MYVRFLCETRAVENSCYFVGVNYGGRRFGGTSMVPPWVDDESDENMPVELGTQDDAHLICRIERGTLNTVRSKFPFHRRLLLSKEESIH